MKRLLLMSTVLIAVLMLPALASATHFTDLVAIGDCEGFTAQVGVHFRIDAEYLDLHYDVAVLDVNNLEIVVVSGDVHVVHDGDQDITIMVSDMFNMALDGTYVVSGLFTLTAPYPGGVDEDSIAFENGIECGSVADEAVTFQSVKAMYR